MERATNLTEVINQLNTLLLDNRFENDFSNILVGFYSDYELEGIQALNTIEAFSPNFLKAINSGYSWVNVSALGVTGGKLVVLVECPSYTENLFKGKTSINYSGSSIEI